MEKIVCVCTGNTCRSPMAAALLGQLLPGVEVSSAGLNAFDGAPASASAVAAMREMGLEIGAHRARRFRPAMAQGALLVAMTRAHAQTLQNLCPDARVVTLLAGADVPDPFGGGPEVYRRTARLLRAGAEALAARLKA